MHSAPERWAINPCVRYIAWLGVIAEDPSEFIVFVLRLYDSNNLALERARPILAPHQYTYTAKEKEREGREGEQGRS